MFSQMSETNETHKDRNMNIATGHNPAQKADKNTQYTQHERSRSGKYNMRPGQAISLRKPQAFHMTSTSCRELHSAIANSKP
jgi:hypothetical protein